MAGGAAAAAAVAAVGFGGGNARSCGGEGGGDDFGERFFVNEEETAARSISWEGWLCSPDENAITKHTAIANILTKPEVCCCVELVVSSSTDCPSAEQASRSLGTVPRL